LSGLLTGCFFILFALIIRASGYIVGAVLAVLFIIFKINHIEREPMDGLVEISMTVSY